jgi:hypothetical protein
VTLLDDRSLSWNASTLADGSQWQSPAVSAVSPLRWRAQRIPVIAGLDITAQRRLRAVYLSRDVRAVDLEKLRSLSGEVNRLLELSEDWDGRGGEPLDLQVVRSAVPIVGDLAILTSVPVELFACPDGGLQAEWHLGQADIEIEFDVDGDVVALVRDQSGDRNADIFDLMQDQIKVLLSSTADPTASRPS